MRLSLASLMCLSLSGTGVLAAELAVPALPVAPNTSQDMFTVAAVVPFQSYQDLSQQELEVLAHQGDQQAMLALAEQFQRFDDTAMRRKAYAWLLKAADAGSVEALYQLGDWSARSSEIENYRNAMQWLSAAAAQGHSSAQTRLAQLYQQGLGTDKDLAQAVQWYQQAAQQGDVEAKIALYQLYQDGKEGAPDAERAAYWAALLAQDPQASLQLARLYKAADRFSPQVVYWYAKAAQAGDAEAQWYLGVHYELGQGVERDVQAALSWYEQAAEQGDEFALARLYAFYQDPAQAQAHPEQAQRWATALPDTEALSPDRVAYWYWYGVDQVLENKKLALPWKIKAAELGDSEEQMRLFFIYNEGLAGIPVDKAKAQYWLNRLYEQEGAYSLYQIGHHYLRGADLERENPAEARVWFQRAAEQGLSVAAFDLGKLYLRGEGGQRDIALALQWITQAAEGGHPRASDFLAKAYEQACVVPKDSAKVDYWRNQMAQQNAEQSIALPAEADEAQSPYQQALELSAGYLTGQDGFEPDAVLAQTWIEQALAFYPFQNIYFDLGQLYRYGMHEARESDLEQAVAWYLKAAELNHRGSFQQLAYLFDPESAVHIAQPDIQQAVHWYRLAALQGDYNAPLRLYQIYHSGLGPLAANPTEAHYWYDLAVSQAGPDLSDVQQRLAYLYADRADEASQQQATLWFLKAAEQSDYLYSVYEELARRYQQGVGVAVDPAMAIQWLKKAAGADTSAAMRVAHAYLVGDGVGQDTTEAIHWYEKAAEGDVLAQLRLYTLYQTGYQGLAIDQEQAQEWLTRAIVNESNWENPYTILASWYEQGDEVVVANPAIATEWYLKAAQFGDLVAQRQVAQRYAQGLGVAADAQQAFQWSLAAAQQGDTLAQTDIAFAYAVGVGVPQDLQQASVWIAKATAQNEEQAKDRLGERYINYLKQPSLAHE